MIKLSSVAGSNEEKPMNDKQKFATYVALAIFGLSILLAPWKVSFITGAAVAPYKIDVGAEYNPVWVPPYKPDSEVSLMVGALLIEWAAIGVFWGASFKLLKSN